MILSPTHSSRMLSIRASISIQAPFFASTPARRNQRRQRSNRALLDSVSRLKPNLRVSARFHTVRQVSRRESHFFVRCYRARMCASRVSKVRTGTSRRTGRFPRLAAGPRRVSVSKRITMLNYHVEQKETEHCIFVALLCRSRTKQSVDTKENVKRGSASERASRFYL